MKPILHLITCALVLSTGTAWAEGQPDFDQLAQAIYKAEGGAKTAHPYGILAHYKHTSPKQACLNTIKHRWAEWAVLSPQARLAYPEGYLRYLQASYSPLGAKNDPSGLNVNWYNNVRRLYEHAQA